MSDVAKVKVDYGARRRASYPAISDQLDALWHAMEAGTLPKVPAFYEPIAAVKARHPKPAPDAVEDGTAC